MNTKILSFDLDGTLLNANHQITTKTKKIIKALKEKGHIIAINTGRSYNACKYYGKLIDADYVLACNGAMIYDNDKNQTIHKVPLDKETSRRVLSLLYDYERNLKIQWDSIETYYSNNITPFETYYIDNYKRDYPDSFFNHRIITDYNEIKNFNEEIYQIFFHSLGKDKTEYSIALKELNQLENVNIVDFKAGCTDINNPLASKGDGLQVLAQSLGIPMEDTIVFGDGDNDISMFKNAGISVAMKNACLELKELAHTITNHHDEDGVAHALIDIFKLETSFA